MTTYRTDGMSRRGFLAGTASITALGMLGLGTAACGSSAGAGKTTARIGWVEPKTGRLAAAYKPIYVGARLALEDLKANGGLLGQAVQVMEEDDKGSPASQPAVAQRLIREEPTFVVGPTGSSQVLASVTALARAKLIQSAWGGAELLGDGDRFPYHYQLVYNTTQQARVAARFLHEVRGLRKIGIIVENSEFGTSIRDAVIATLRDSYSAKPVAVEVFEVDASDMTPFVRNLERAGVDGLGLFTGQPQATILILRAMAASDFHPVIVSHDLNYIEALGEFPRALLDGFFGTTYRGLTYTGEEEPSAEVRALVERIDKHPDTAGLGYSAVTSPYYDYMMLMAKVIEETKSLEPAKLKAALDQVDGYQGVRAKVSFTAKRHSGIADEDITVGTLMSAKEPQSLGGVLRRRADGM
ncbi:MULTISPECIES: ABC transporter substrate-binding protein [Nonomuraea]|uniref:ABC transporter substrate-binding protein n=2 Tax=Nonomuraea TaxID=83681 RepID=A0ABW1C9I7_9ACTN|nr:MULTISPECIES: ABC transporter substrate-binding protein [Nonomuraea]MDA0640264.1 ABC transporter substrate-binding protein [Nonomuraea ferruginea]